MYTNKDNSFIKSLFIYSLLFCVTALGVYFFYALHHETLLWIGDGLHQLYPKLVRTKYLFASIFSGDFPLWSWDNGLGVDTITFYKSSLLDPTIWIACLFPLKYIDLGYSISVVLKLYLAGFTFLLFAHKKQNKQFLQVIGAISYAFSSWIVIVSLTQGHLLISSVLFPLIILGIENIFNNKSPVLFCITVMLQVIYSTYFAYMVAIMVIVYYFVRWIVSCDHFSIAAFLKDTLSFMAYGIIGIALSAVLSINSIYSLSSISVDSGAAGSFELFFSIKQYLRLLTSFTTGTIYESYSVLALPGLFLVLLPLVLKHASGKNANSIMATICIVLTLFPFVSSMFNGGSYVTGRWFFMLFFFVIWSVIDCIEADYIYSRKALLSSIVWLGLLTIAYAISFNNELLNNNEKLYGAFSIIFAILSLMIFYRQKTRFHYCIISIFLIFNIVICNNVIYLYSVSDSFVPYRIHTHVGKAYRQFDTAVQKASNYISDKSFYRVDQVTGVVDSPLTRIPYNENLFHGERSVNSYFSTLNGNWIAFNHAVGNSAGLVRRVYVFSNDNRPALDTLMGVKYFLGNCDHKSTNASMYVPYGYSFYKQLNNTEVFKNNYSIGIGAFFDKCILESEYSKYNYSERDQLLLQTVVITDKEKEKVPQKLFVDSKKIDCGVDDMPFSVISSKGVVVNDNSIVVNSIDNELNIAVDNSYDFGNKQVMLSFTDLVKDKDVPDPKSKQFIITANNGIIKKRLINERSHPQGFSSIVDYNINFGSFDNWNGRVSFKFNKCGTYSFDSMKLYATSNDSYSKYANRLKDNAFNLETFDNDRIKGYVEAYDDGLVLFSIPSNMGWNIYVDGKKATKLNYADYAFTAIEVEKGRHDIILKYSYPGMIPGLTVSITSLLLLIVISIKRKKYKSKNSIE